jgi:L-seryl-tRNA(Ser) seleniumtransferase
MEDLGSGCLVDLSAHGVNEPVVRASIEAGASLITFSGDKMVGGPQAGLIAGKKELVARIRRHPLFRALRIDKLSIAALETTLSAYLAGNLDEVPALRMIRLGADSIRVRARDFVAGLRSQIPAGEVDLDIVPGSSLIGGGSTPDRELPTYLIRIASARYSAAQLEARLRKAPQGISVIARVESDRLVLDLRTVFPEQQAVLAATLSAVLH